MMDLEDFLINDPDPVVDYLNGARPKPGSKEEDDLVELAFIAARKKGFPYLPHDPDLVQREFSKLKAAEPTFDSENRVIRQTSHGMTLANTYHPEMMNVRCRGRKWTPLDVFHDDVKFRLAIRRFIKYGGIFMDRGIRMATCMERDSQAVGNFRPTASRAILSYFQPEFAVDFCAGWGGRMVGAMSLGVPYVGIDPNTVSLAANQKMAEDIGRVFNLPVPELVCACAEDVLGQGRWNPDLIFTSPPYFNVEAYSDEPTQSYLRYPGLDKWYEGFLRPCILGAYKDLRSGGHLVLNINPDMGDRTLAIAKEVGFTYLETWGLAISRRQYRKDMGSHQYEPATKALGKYRHEPVLVFKKV